MYTISRSKVVLADSTPNQTPMADSEELAFKLQFEEWAKAGRYLLPDTSSPEAPELSDSLKIPLDRLMRKEAKESYARNSGTGMTDELLLEEALLLSCRPQAEVISKISAEVAEIERDLLEGALLLSCLPRAEVIVKPRTAEVENQLTEQLKLSSFVPEQRQLTQTTLLAQRIELENAEEYASQVFDLFYAEARDDRGYVGVSCVLKDAENTVVFQNRECFGLEVSHHVAEYTALLNGLAYARSTGVRQINAHGNSAFIYCEFNGLAELRTSEQLDLLTRLHTQVKELISFNLDCVSEVQNVDAINLAKYAIDSYVVEVKNNQSNAVRRWKEKLHEEEKRTDCLICYEKIFALDMVVQKACAHQFCFNCLSQHVENEIRVGKVPVRCPQYFLCHSTMGLHDCQSFLSAKALDNYATRLTEAVLTDAEKVYCPFPNCSAMMCTNANPSRITRASSSRSAPQKDRSPIGAAECMECHRLFCVECHVPWHGDLTCQQYQQLPPGERDSEDIKFFQLAKDEKWKRCRRCRSMIVLSAGCFHITCRCGNEFCYICEKEYVDKKKICSCPLFDTHRSGRR